VDKVSTKEKQSRFAKNRKDNMRHFGDVTKIHGSELPVVDVITGGSPCQDLSIAGRREGLAGERSGLFMEQIRIVKEMREHDRATRGTNEHIRHIRPRYMVWENVPGAFSSNKGEDFRAVLEETAKVADKDAVIPRPADGKWTYSGCIMGNGWSIAWRTHDAQYWGVPQRRKRICLVADFDGDTAGKILFDVQLWGEAEYAEAFKIVTDTRAESRHEVQPLSEGVSRDTEQGEPEREGTPSDAEGSAGATSYTLKIRGGVEVDSYGKKAGKGPLVQTELSATLGVSQDQTLITGINGDVAGTLDASYFKGCGERQGIERDVVCFGISAFESNAMKSNNPHSGIYEARTSRTLDNNGGNPACNQGGMMVVEEAVCIGNGQVDQLKESDKVGALNCMHDQQAILTYGLDRASFNQGENAKFDFSIDEELSPPIVARGPGGS
jgi:DNA (cytosine-5)-methyltransferase 1